MKIADYADDDFVTLIDNKNWGESMLKNTGFTNLAQAKEMIKSGMGKYYFRERLNVDMPLIKEKFAEFLKKPDGKYGNLKEIADYSRGNFKKVFGKKYKFVKAELKNNNFTSFNNILFIKKYN